MDRDERDYLASHRSHDIEVVLRRWRKVARGAGLRMDCLAEAGGYPVMALTNRRTVRDEPGLYLSAGIHGDEPAAVEGLLDWAEQNVAFLKTHPVIIVPCLNPWGLVHNLRTDQDGRDLNRNFERDGGNAICAVLDYIEDREFTMAVSLHEDYDARGIYLYELTRRGLNVGDALLSKVEALIPRQSGMVEGRRAENGVIRRSRGVAGIAAEIDGMPEAIYLHLHHAVTALTYETPSEFSLYRRVQAQVRFLEGVREMIRA